MRTMYEVSFNATILANSKEEAVAKMRTVVAQEGFEPYYVNEKNQVIEA
jgi:hypothetical protein